MQFVEKGELFDERLWRHAVARVAEIDEHNDHPLWSVLSPEEKASVVLAHLAAYEDLFGLAAHLRRD